MCKHSEILKTVMDLMVWKYKLKKARYVKQIDDIREWQKNRQSSTIRLKKVMSEKNQGLQRREVGTLFYDKNNVIAENVLSYFLCLSSKFKV